MKRPLKIIIIIIICLLVLPLAYFITDSFFLGDVSDVSIDLGTSEIYSEEERADMAQKVLQIFRLQFQDCTLHDIWYAGDEECLWEQKDIPYDEVMVFDTNFDAGPHAGPINNGYAHQTCPGYSFVFGRDDDGSWILIDCGYAETVSLRYLAHN